MIAGIIVSVDPLLTDNLADLLSLFPNSELHGIVSILKNSKSLSPFPARRATRAHEAHEADDLRPHAPAIAEEVVWWGSNEVHLQRGQTRTWVEIVADVASKNRVSAEEADPQLPAWKIEQALFRKAMATWETLTAEQREEAMRSTPAFSKLVRRGAVPALGTVASVGGRFLFGRGLPLVAGATAFATIATAMSALWMGYELAGPAYRVLQPISLSVAYTRVTLRHQRLADAFRDLP